MRFKPSSLYVRMSRLPNRLANGIATGGMVGTFFPLPLLFPCRDISSMSITTSAILDEEGYELADRSAAWAEATAAAGEMIRDLDGRLQPGKDWRLEVTDENKKPVYVINISGQAK